MSIEYKSVKEFAPKDLEDLFLSVGWESGKYPEKLAKGMKNSSHVISAWDGNKLVGLVRGLDDGETVAFIHYLLVNPKYQGMHIGDELMKHIMKCFHDLLYVKIMPSDPKTKAFYKRFGFVEYDNYCAMETKNFM